MAQSPTIAIPKKSTDEVDWTGPIRSIIKQSYGENPDNYASECASLQRCRQDAVRGAGSDLTGERCLITSGLSSDPCYSISCVSFNKVLWSTGASGATFFGNSCLISLARCLYWQTHDTDFACF